MKRKVVIIAIALLASLCIAFAAEYHYGFILSCGKTIYRSYDAPLSDNELLMLTDLLEDTHCPKNAPSRDQF